MHNSVELNGKKIVTLSSQHSVTLAIGWPEDQIRDLLGFAIRRYNPDGSVIWLEGMLAFKSQTHAPGEPISSNEAPFQKMFWADYTVRPGQAYNYEIVPVVGQPGSAPDLSQAIKIPIQTEDNASAKHQVYFNRAVMASQAYARNFGLVDPTSNPRILQWLARGLDEAILEFIGRAEKDKSLRLDVAAYHLDHPDIISALAKVGLRARVCLCWKKDDDKKRNRKASTQLKTAKVKVYHREEVPAISHNKYIILKNASGAAQAVLMGSTNFTVGGVSMQNNVSHIIENPDLAAAYLKDFELQIGDDNDALRDANQNWETLPADQGSLGLNFSPHQAGERVDLDKYVELVNGAESSAFFATFRATDEALLKALTSPQKKNVVVRGLVDKVYEQGAGEVLLYHRAQQKSPDVVPATSIRSSIDPLQAELARKGFNPLVHHKFIVLDFNTPNCTVITGSANYSKNSTEKNDENTLIVQQDRRVAEFYLGEFFRIYEHYRSRWILNRGRKQPSVLYLKEDGSWAKDYYGTGYKANFLRVLLATG